MRIIMKKVFVYSILLLLGVTLLSTLLLSVHTYRQLQTEQKDSLITQVNLSYQHDMLRYCLEKQITPCTNDSVQAWNEKHPSDTLQ